jgi:hypothetical protein
MVSGFSSAFSICRAKTVVASVPGVMPIIVPTTYCQSLMRIAPATIPTTGNGATGATVTASTETRPCLRTAFVVFSSRFPATRRSVLSGNARPTKYVASAEPTMPVMATAKPYHGPNAITAKSVMSGRGNMRNAAGV